MSRSTSTYLDLLRFLAAVIVFLGHLSDRRISGGFLWQLQGYGHGAVVIFFVLSGFVIAYVSETKERSLEDYALSRLSRLYSVVFPALLLTFLLDWLGIRINPSVYHMSRETMPVIRLLTAMSFTSQSWFFSIDIFSNGPYWSLPYEFWYYVIFGCVIFLSGATRIILIAIAALIAGPKILVMAPIWAIGAVAYYFSLRVTLRTAVAWLLFAASFAVVLLSWRPIIAPGNPVWPLEFTLNDYALGMAIAINLLASAQLEFHFMGAAPPIKWAAGFTFSLYLFHLPLLYFAAAVAPAGMPIVLRSIGMMIFVIICVLLLGTQTEHKKHVLKRWMAAAFRACSVKIRAI